VWEEAFEQEGKGEKGCQHHLVACTYIKCNVYFSMILHITNTNDGINLCASRFEDHDDDDELEMHRARSSLK
jgi:hypothetical protein